MPLVQGNSIPYCFISILAARFQLGTILNRDRIFDFYVVFHIRNCPHSSKKRKFFMEGCLEFIKIIHQSLAIH